MAGVYMQAQTARNKAHNEAPEFRNIWEYKPCPACADLPFREEITSTRYTSHPHWSQERRAFLEAAGKPGSTGLPGPEAEEAKTLEKVSLC